MIFGTEMRVVLGALAGVGLGGVALLTVIPALVPVERADPRSLPAPGSVGPEVIVPKEAPLAEAQAPRFDTVRLAPDGSGLVAGQALPGAKVAVVAGEEVAAEVTADPDGRFVAFLELPASSEPRILSLRDEAGIVSEETVIVAPIGGSLAGVASSGEGLSQDTATAAGAAPEADAPAGQGTEMASASETALDSAEGAEEAEAGRPGLGDLAGTTPEVGTSADAATALALTDPAAPELPAEQAATSPLDGEMPGQEAVLLSDAEGVRVLQPPLAPGADAETLSSVALDAIGYGGEGEVLLSGRAPGGGAVRLYLDNGRVADVPIGADGQWSATLGGTAPGDYTLRVDQIDPEGEVVSRIETPFRREARDDLAAAMAQAGGPGQTIAMRTVQPGNTLWAIARERYGEPMMYVRVFEMNRDRIRDPDLIYPGQVFVLPTDDTP